MKDIIELFADRNTIFKDFERIEISALKSRKRVKIYSALDLKGFYNVIFVIDQKSRFLVKNAKDIIELENRLEALKNHIYRYKFLVISSPICSKSRQFLKDNGWKVIDDTL